MCSWNRFLHYRYLRLFEAIYFTVKLVDYALNFRPTKRLIYTYQYVFLKSWAAAAKVTGVRYCDWQISGKIRWIIDGRLQNEPCVGINSGRWHCIKIVVYKKYNSNVTDTNFVQTAEVMHKEDRKVKFQVKQVATVQNCGISTILAKSSWDMRALYKQYWVTSNVV